MWSSTPPAPCSEAARAAEGRLPDGLSFMQWSRGASRYEPDELTALVRYLRPQPKQESLAESSRQRAEKKMRVLEQARRAAGHRAAR